mmetsp:Transcript_34727/g.69162  ORF Transcript_34727/g.69162 Transcript_34727/m.69162 type:complete len:86 (-) Transcript_34727:147-404(-)
MLRTQAEKSNDATDIVVIAAQYQLQGFAIRTGGYLRSCFASATASAIITFADTSVRRACSPPTSDFPICPSPSPFVCALSDASKG